MIYWAHLALWRWRRARLIRSALTEYLDEKAQA